MAPENQMKEGITSRQKIIGVVFVIILIIIGYQVIGLFKNDTGETITPSPTPANNAANKAPTNGPNNAANNVGNVPAHPAGPAQPQPMNTAGPQQLREVPVGMEPRIADLQRKTQQEYLDQINRLQSLKIQREIAETNQAIAAAKLATVTAEKNVTDLLTRPTQSSIPGVYTPGNLPAPPQGGVTSSESVPAAPQQAAAEVPYTVVSVSMELGRWSAVLSFQNKLYHVSIGDVIPLDGSVVAGINKSGVMLMKDGKRRKISMTSSV